MESMLTQIVESQLMWCRSSFESSGVHTGVKLRNSGHFTDLYSKGLNLLTQQRTNCHVSSRCVTIDRQHGTAGRS